MFLTYDGGIDLPFPDNFFTKIYSILTIQHIDEHVAFFIFKDMLRVLRPAYPRDAQRPFRGLAAERTEAIAEQIEPARRADFRRGRGDRSRRRYRSRRRNRGCWRNRG